MGFSHSDSAKSDALKNYVVQEEMGRNIYNFTIVQRVKSQKDKQQYVLKQIDMQHMLEEQKEEVFRERNLMEKCKHPNIVNCISTFEEDRKMNIVLEYCEKRDLDHYIRQQNQVPLQESQIFNIFTMICFGLLSLHQRGILHRDLKLANIFMTENETVKIGDLGISRQMENTMQKA